MVDLSTHIVIDNGSSTTKAGFNGENAPRAVLPSVIGTYKNPETSLVTSDDKIFIGKEAISLSSILNIKYPLDTNIHHEPNYEYMEKIWESLFFDHLKVSPESHNVFLLESYFSSNKSRESLAEIMFEKFNIFNIHIESQTAMALWSTTKRTGLVVDSGNLFTQVMPIFEEYIIPDGIKTSSISGKTMTKSFENLINKYKPRYCNFSNAYEIAKKIKEEISFIDIENSSKDNSNSNRECINYTLPDNNILSIPKYEISNITNSLFNPELLELDDDPIQDLILQSLESCDINIRKELAHNIILSGGNTMIKGYTEKLKQNLLKTLGKNYENTLKINSQPEREFSSWIGASVFCSFNNFQNMWISKNEFEEEGSKILHKTNY